MTVKYYRDSSNTYLGASNSPMVGGIEVASAPLSAAATWNGSSWDEPVVVPQTVTKKQARLALHGAGLLSSVEEYLNGLSEPTKTPALITWETASTIDRDDDLTKALISGLALSEESVDALFITAASL